MMNLHTSLLLASSCGMLLCAGCGGGSAAPADNAAKAPASNSTQAAKSPSETKSTPQPESSSTAKVDPERKETKWIGEIPYDVFYDQPLTVATDVTAVTIPSPGAAATTASPSMPSPTPGSAAPAGGTPPASSTAPPAASASSGSVNWEEVIPMPQLVQEVKSLRTELTQNLQTVATFNRGTNAISLDAAIITALAAVATVHPGDVSWKPNAKFVRDLSYEVYSNASGSGREPFMKSKEPFERMLIVLDGGQPPEMQSDDVVPFGDIIYVADMMKRIDASFNKLNSNINTPDKLKEDPAGTEREFRILATLATIMSDKESYSSAEEQKYQDFLKRFIGGTKAGIEATKTDNFEGFQSAMNEIQKTCAECHQEYRSKESAF